MKKFIFAVFISVTTLNLSGCNDLLQQLNNLISPEAATESDVYKNKLKEDLKVLDTIRPEKNTSFLDLEEKLRQASQKTTSSIALRSELKNLSSLLSSQNNRFQDQHFHTAEVAKIRNIVMQLNYAAIDLIQVVDNPVAINNKLNGYLNKQNRLINDYNKLITEVEAKL